MMIGRGSKFQDLYILDSQKLSSASINNVNLVSFPINNAPFHTWHNRLGHFSFKQLHFLSSLLHCTVPTCNTQPCYVCPLAKHKRLPFVSHKHLSKSPFDLIHCDIWGPYPANSLIGYKFFFTIVDDCTRFTWVYLLKHKSDVASAIPQFFNMISTQF